MRWIGIAERAFELLCRHANDAGARPGELLSERQTVQTWIADSRAQIAAATLLVLQAAWKIDREGARAAREEISMIKFHTARMLGDVLDRALQAHGALGMTDLTPLAYFYRHERAARIYDGPDEVHQSVVARAALRRLSAGAGAPDPVNESVAPRPGEEIDAAALGAFVRAELGLEGELSIRQFPAGFSNLTYEVSVADRKLVLRRPPVGSTVKSAHDMGARRASCDVCARSIRWSPRCWRPATTRRCWALPST
jgi:hypothetical protein